MAPYEVFVRDRGELERRLIGDLSRASPARAKEGPVGSSGMLIAGLTLGLPVTAVLLYLALGTPPSGLPLP